MSIPVGIKKRIVFYTPSKALLSSYLRECSVSRMLKQSPVPQPVAREARKPAGLSCLLGLFGLFS